MYWAENPCQLNTADGFIETNLDDALVEHRVGDRHETGDVGANYEIAREAVLLGSFPGIFEKGRQDVAQRRINFFVRARHATVVLRILKPGRGYARGSGCFDRT